MTPRAISILSLAVAAAIWLPAMHLFYRPNAATSPAAPLSSYTIALMRSQTDFWQNPDRRAREWGVMRATNPEWDFMGRSYVAWSMANIALCDPARKGECLRVMDQIIADTLWRERENGVYYFLMPYAHDKPFLQKTSGNQFLDGEIALMLGLRRLVEDRQDYKDLLAIRVKRITARMESSPTLSSESYPDECWTFCNSVALAALATADALDGTDHSALMRRWIALAKSRLTDPKTGLLISSYRLNGDVISGPQGSSVWMVAHCLQVVDAEYARDQYERGKKLLGHETLGFGYSAEWPKVWQGPQNVDSGVVLPGLDASPGSTGLAVLGASSFHDDAYRDALLATIDYGALPIEKNGALRYAVSNQVGDAVLLYASVTGPAWDFVQKRRDK